VCPAVSGRHRQTTGARAQYAPKLGPARQTAARPCEWPTRCDARARWLRRSHLRSAPRLDDPRLRLPPPQRQAHTCYNTRI